MKETKPHRHYSEKGGHQARGQHRKDVIRTEKLIRKGKLEEGVRQVFSSPLVGVEVILFEDTK